MCSSQEVNKFWMNTGIFFSFSKNFLVWYLYLRLYFQKDLTVWSFIISVFFFIFYGQLFYLVFSYAFYSFIIQDKESINKRGLEKSEDFIRLCR